MKTAFDTAKGYLDKLPPAISGNGGHNATFRAACWLVKCGLGDSEALALLLEYNRRCLPPWTEKELAHKLADARRLVKSHLVFTPVCRPALRVAWKVLPWNSTPAPTVEGQPEESKDSFVKKTLHGSRAVAVSLDEIFSNNT
jgi:hypothetical protein